MPTISVTGVPSNGIITGRREREKGRKRGEEDKRLQYQFCDLLGQTEPSFSPFAYAQLRTTPPLLLTLSLTRPIRTGLRFPFIILYWDTRGSDSRLVPLALKDTRPYSMKKDVVISNGCGLFKKH